METRRSSAKGLDAKVAGPFEKAANFGKKIVNAAIVATAIGGGYSATNANAETITSYDKPVAQASAGTEYMQTAVSSTDSNVGGYSTVVFDTSYTDPSVKLQADSNDVPFDTSMHPMDKFYTMCSTLTTEGGDVVDVEHNYTTSLMVGDKITSEVSIQSNGTATYAPVSLDILDFDLSGNPNGVDDILISYEGDTNQDGIRELTGSILASDAIENHGGNIVNFQQLCMPNFDYREDDVFMTVTYEAVGNVPEASTLGLLASGALAGAGVAVAGRRRKEDSE